MSAIVPFQFEQHQVRVLDRDGDPWFVGNDVCRVLGLSDARQALDKLDDDERGRCSVPTPSGGQEMRVVNESGLYTLILRCREATTPGTVPHRFRKWVTGEVLPSIRRTGSYGRPDAAPLLNDPATLRTLLLANTEKVLALEERVSDLTPKAEALERIATSEGSLCITDAAKTLQVRPRELFRYLRAHSWIYTRAGTAHDVAYQARLVAGDLEHKATTVVRADGSEKTVTQVRVTPKGLAKLAQLIAPVATAA